MTSFHWWWFSLTQSCPFRPDISPLNATLNAVVVSTWFVGALYLLVPPRVRRLSRDHPTHIKYRTIAIVVVCTSVLATYPFLFCTRQQQYESDDASSVLQLVGWNATWPIQNNKDYTLGSLLWVVLGVVLHTWVLYLGPTVAFCLGAHVATKEYNVSYWQVLKSEWDSFCPENPSETWKTIRNFVVAPWSEELVFRGCCIPPFLATWKNNPTRVVLVVPLFFGIAHLHHAWTRLLQPKEHTKTVVLSTLFQFLYTSLFGMYAAHVVVATGSVEAAVASHVFCNYMGLPRSLVTAWDTKSALYRYRWIVATAYLLGINGFVLGFTLGPFPSPSLGVVRMDQSLSRNNEY